MIKPTSVLIIDDSKVITKLTAKALLFNKIKNYYFHEEHIYIAHNGMEAFSILSAYPQISLVISDLIMPELSGEELIEILIDTGKISSLEVIFISSQVNTDRLSKNIKEHIKGIIYKPFSDSTFSVVFNQMQAEDDKKKQHIKKLKQIHSKQIKYINSWIYDYCQKENILFSQDVLDKIVSDEYNHNFEITKEELFMIFYSVASGYTYAIDNSYKLNTLVLQNIYNAWLEPQKYKRLGIIDEFEEIVSIAQTSLSIDSSEDEIKFLLTLPINQLLVKTKNIAKTKQTLLYNDFVPYLNELIDKFVQIDSKYSCNEVQAILEHIKEIVEFESLLKGLLNKTAVIEKFQNLKEAPKIIEDIRKYFNACIKYIKGNVIPFYVYKANQVIWREAKKSSKITIYLKSNLKKKMINTHNLLYHLNIINRQEMKNFQKYDRDKIFIFTKNLEILTVFKKLSVEKVPSLEISLVNTFSIFKKELEKQQNSKLVIDLNFTNSVFADGLQMLKFIIKKIPAVEPIIYSNNLYLLVTFDELEKLKQNKIKVQYKVILKPINTQSIFEEIYLKN